MYRYIAFAWNYRRFEQQRLAERLTARVRSTMPEWECVLATESLQVYQTGQRPRSCRAYVLTRNIGVVLGNIFIRNGIVDSNRREVMFSDDESRMIVQTNGQRLVERYWGRYVALLAGCEGSHVAVLRDPTGAMPCQLTNFRGINVVCSHIVDCASLGLIDCSINWDHIASFLWFHRLISKETGLESVEQVQAGECITLGPDQMETTFCWSPDRIYAKRTLEYIPEAMHELKDVVQHCVASWASCYSSILHELSGGLDSAIVLACLSEMSDPPRLVGQNFYTAGAEGDERAFAQEAANRAGVELLFTPLRSSDLSFEQMIDYTKVATPTLTPLRLESMLLRESLVRRRDIEAVFSGQGGDHLFQRASTRLIAAEYASRHGLTLSLLPVVLDTSRFTRQSIWSVMATVVTSGLLHRHRDPYVQRLKPPPFLSEATRDALDFSLIRHPWVDGAANLPASKILQILNIVDSQNFYHTSSAHTEIVHPLISQPIIELCLQIPCYVMTYGGIDRALARDAFAGMIPSAIARRTSKGGTTGYVHRQLVDNVAFLREFLLDGVLIKHGILDREKTENHLDESSLIRNSHLLFPILVALRAEIWVKTWTDNARRAAA